VADANDGEPYIALVQADRLEKIRRISFVARGANVLLRRVQSDVTVVDHNTGMEVQQHETKADENQYT
jgi:hypothetical protein